MQIRSGWTKYVNRKAVESEIPDEIVWRKNKLGWPNAEKEWVRGPLKNFLDETIKGSEFLKRVKKGELIAVLNGCRTKFQLRELNLALWHNLFFENKSKKL